MKLFEHVAIVGTSESSTPLALQSVLQEMGVNVHLYRFYQKRNVEDFFAGKGVPEECAHTVICAHGLGPDEDPRIRFDVVEQVDNDPEAVEGWRPLEFELTKDNIPELVSAPRGTLGCWGCGAGREPLAKAFLKAGYEAYVGATEPYIDGDSSFLFLVGFFYYLLADERDYAPRTFTAREATAKAANMDGEFELGTRPFRYWDTQDIASR